MPKVPISVSVIVPVHNEEAYLAHFESVIQDTSSKIEVEFLFVDGCSTDRSLSIVQDFAAKFDNVLVLENKKRTVSFGLNLALGHSRGRYICRMDCHSIYPKDYILMLLKQADDLIANNVKLGNVGGIVKTIAASDSHQAKAIAFAMSSPIGVGNSTFRTSQSGNDLVSVDTVPFGFFPSTVFKDVGTFDEALVRNQDDHFNAVLKKNGYKIFVDTSIEIAYMPRSNLRALWKMFYQYGYYKPLAAKKIGEVYTIRQLAPAALVIYVIFWLISSAFLGFSGLLSLPLLFYLGLVIALTFSTNPIAYIYRIVSVVALHCSYGIGYLAGLRALLPGGGVIEHKPNR